MAISCIVTKMKQDRVKNRTVFISLLHKNLLRKIVANIFALFISQQSHADP